MQVEVELEFKQIVKIVKKLSSTQWKKLKMEIEKNYNSSDSSIQLENLLMEAPTFTKKQLEEISRTRKAINEWRIK